MSQPNFSPLQRAISEGLKPGNSLATEIHKLQAYSVDTRADAQAIVAALDALGPRHFHGKADEASAVVALLQQVGTKEAFEVLSAQAIPRLIAVFDAPAGNDDFKLFLLKIFAMYQSEQGATRICHAAHQPLQPQAYMWSIIFQSLRVDHPVTRAISDALADPIPQDFIGIAYLDLTNAMAVKGTIQRHPFDTQQGLERLESLLIDSHPRSATYAASAAGALPFLSAGGRDRLLALAMDHPDINVQMRAAWAAAKLGSEGGIKVLSRCCLDPRHGQRAWGYLESLGRQEMIPIEAQRPDFRAMAEMCNWLAHPMEFGRPPDEITQYDSRELNWPPTNDRRKVWLFRYRYKSPDPAKPDTTGAGMVGSVTFSLFSETTDDLSPQDIYALHCCWELQNNKDPRAPKTRTPAAGRAILGI